MKNKIKLLIIMKKKLNIFGANLEWATAHLYCKKNIVLQDGCIWLKIVL